MSRKFIVAMLGSPNGGPKSGRPSDRYRASDFCQYGFYVETLATTHLAISGLSRHTPSDRIVKSAGCIIPIVGSYPSEIALI